MRERLSDAIARAGADLKIYERVHSDLEEGKDWETIDNGTRKSGTEIRYEAWLAYMQQRLINHLRSICIASGPKSVEEPR